MKILLICVILTVTIGRSIAIVCKPNVCDTVRCGNPRSQEDCPGKLFKPNGGFCGCCNACLTLLKEGEVCENRFNGSPPTFTCTPPLECKSFDSSPARCTVPYASPPFIPLTEDCDSMATAYASASTN